MRQPSTVISISLVFALGTLGTLGGCGSKSPGAGDDDGTGDGGGGGGSGDGGDGAHPGTVLLTLHHRPTNPAPTAFLVAFQDGAGPWQAAPAPTGDTYALPIFAPAYAVAWTCIATGPAGGALRQVNLYQFATAERPALALDIPPRCGDPVQTVTVHGTIANPGILTSYVVKLGDRSAVVNQQDQFTLQVPPGSHDLIVLAGSSLAANGDLVATDAIVRRDVAVTGNTELTIDANDEQPITSFSVDNMLGGSASTTLYTGNGTVAQLVADSTPLYENASLAADQMAAADVYDAALQVTSGTQITASSTATATPGAETWVEIAPLGTVTATVATAPSPRVTSGWPGYANAIGYTWLGTQTPTSAGCGGAACTIAWTAWISAQVLGTAGTFTMPDLTGVTGWKPALQMVAGTKVSGGVQAMTSSTNGDFPPATPPSVGTHRTFAASQFSVTP